MSGRWLQGLYLVAAAGGLLLAARGIGVRQDAPADGGDGGCDGGVLVSVGDVLLGMSASARIERHGWDDPLREVAPLLDGADVVMGNLEGPVTRVEERISPGRTWAYKHEPEAADALARAGFGVLALANNHTLDYGVDGLAETLEQLRRAGITAIGAGPDEEAARRGTVVRVGDTRVGLLAYMEPSGRYERKGWFAHGADPGVAAAETQAMQIDIARLRRDADVVVVHAHFGRYQGATTRDQERIARELIDLGADAVNGHGSHVAQGIEVYRGKPILYSLGNFVFGTKGRFDPDEPAHGMVARYRFCGGALRRVEVDLIETDNAVVRYRPTPVADDEERAALRTLMRPYGTSLRWEGGRGIVELD